jgi:hypothetical protein
MQQKNKNPTKILDEGISNPDSPEAKFIHDMRLLIIQTKTKVKDILEKEKHPMKE